MSMIIPILKAIAVLGSMGIVLGALLVIASRIFYVEKDPRIDEVKECLPGANCGGCGLPGCDALAEAIVKGTVPVNACPVGGGECAKKIAAVMGIEVSETAKLVAHVACQGCKENAKDKFNYYGAKSCTEAMIAANGQKACDNGCLGFGSCVEVCKFDAIHLNEKGIPVVDEDKCTSCSACITECPKNVIKLVPQKKHIRIACNNHEKGKAVKQVCTSGCIACGICVKKCPFEAISIPEGSNLPVIDYDKCRSCGICMEKCPQKAIISTYL